jgi:hypothetical protein
VRFGDRRFSIPDRLVTPPTKLHVNPNPPTKNFCAVDVNDALIRVPSSVHAALASGTGILLRRRLSRPVRP